MNRIAWLMILVITATAAEAQTASAADEAFENLAKEFLSDLPNFSPVAATLAGDHSADDRLDQVDAEARRRRAELYREYQQALEGVDRSQLSRANQVDYELLEHEVESSLWALNVLQEWAWNPLVYVNTAGSSIYSLVARDFAPLPERLLDVAARLEQLPRFLEQARGSLQPARVPAIHASTAVAQNQGLVTIIDEMVVPDLDALTGPDRARLEAAIDTARSTLAAHQTWLVETLQPEANGEFRIGAALYDVKLAYALDSPLTRRDIRTRAELEYDRVRQEMYDVAKGIYARLYPYTAFPDQPTEAFKQAIIRTALEQAYQKLPPADGIVEVAREQLEQATQFVRDKDIVSLPDDPVEIIIMPEFQRGVAIAYLDPPGPLDKGQSAFYAVAPLPQDWTEEQVRSFLREYNLYSMQDLTIHEGVPGHYLQLAFSNRYPSALRSVFYSGTFVEGWAVYAERVMIDEGYLDGDPLMRLINLKWYLRAITNAIIDSAIHVDGMTREAALKLMIEGGFQEEREAAGKWVRAQLTSAQLSTYFVGYQEHVGMRAAVEAAWADDFTLKRYHDAVLSHGSPPVKFVRALILGEPIPDD